MQDGCLLWGCRVVVPPQGREAVITLLHEGHPGICRMKRLARGYIWWPGIDGELEPSSETVHQVPGTPEAAAKGPNAPVEMA